MGSKKVAILGGGVGGLSTAFYLTELDPLGKDYDITVYQMGWRLGGKCASSRNPQENYRIEEHGIHLFGGFYYNTFAVMKKAYDELQRSNTDPLSSIKKAFIPSSFAVMWETFGQQMYEWDTDAKPSTTKHPWDVTAVDLSAVNLVKGALKNIFDQLFHTVGKIKHPDAIVHGKFLASLEKDIGINSVISRLLEQLKEHLLDDFDDLLGDLSGILDKLMKFSEMIDHEIDKHPTKLRHLYYQLDFMLALLRGFIKDDIAKKGFASLEEDDWIPWLQRHGLSAATLASPLPITSPNILFAFENGDTSMPPKFAAGAMLHWTLLMLNYTHSRFYFFAAGTGETIIQPLYEVLKKRGVKFEFFHKVKSIAQTEGAISHVDFDVQCTLNSPSQGYQPLDPRPVRGLTGWPDFPLCDQLVEGDRLQQPDSHGRRYNLESYWSSWTPASTKTIHQGADFDVAVCALSIGALPSVASDLIDNNPSWRDMVDNVKAIQTQAFQAWFTEEKGDLLSDNAAKEQGIFVSGNYLSPTSDAAELGHLVKFEDWHGRTNPAKSVMYFCGPMAEDEPVPAFSDIDYPHRQHERVKNQAIQLMQAAANPLMPKATVRSAKGVGDAQGLNFELLAVADESSVSTPYNRAHQQFFRANIDPTERYVLSLPGSAKYRLKPSESGYQHLYLAGDWTDNHYNFGSVESTMISGNLAASAIAGKPAKVIGFALSGVGRKDFKMTST
jgi:uncharacterized protein with NAD-binding domain and iron-sulfur cluster